VKEDRALLQTKTKTDYRKTKITPKEKANLNYREINKQKKAYQANDSSQKEESITHLPETEIGRGH
jgi:hypothetical protein